MAEQMRSWVISERNCEWDVGVVVEGPLIKGEWVEVIEKVRVLDLLEQLFEAYAEDGAMDPRVGIPVETLLREHGRLGGNPRC